MTKNYRLTLIKISFYIGALIIPIIIQSVTWTMSVSSLMIPQLWILVVAYFCVYRNSFQSILIIYLIAILLAPTTLISFGKILVFSSVIYIISQVMRPFDIKNIRTFLLFCVGLILAFPFFDGLLSMIIAVQPFSSYKVTDWIGSIFLTLLSIVFLIPLFYKFDHWIKAKETAQNI